MSTFSTHLEPMQEELPTHHKVISLRLPVELLHRIDIAAKNAHGINRTTWIIQALDCQMKHESHVSDAFRYMAGGKVVDKNKFITYDKPMKQISKSFIAKIIVVCLLTAAVAGCVGASLASGASIWSFTSGYADKISDQEREALKKEIKEEISKDLIRDLAEPRIQLQSVITSAS
jgi:hypothetical protein